VGALNQINAPLCLWGCLLATSPVGQGLVAEGAVPHVEVGDPESLHGAVGAVGIRAPTKVHFEQEVSWDPSQIAQIFSDIVDIEKHSVLKEKLNEGLSF
jgi:hypothetical protein